MKLSVSLPAEDVAALDAEVERRGLPSRSAALREAIRHYRHPDLESDYVDAWDEWETSGDRESWESATRDGIT